MLKLISHHYLCHTLRRIRIKIVIDEMVVIIVFNVVFHYLGLMDLVEAIELTLEESRTNLAQWLCEELRSKVR